MSKKNYFREVLSRIAGVQTGPLLEVSTTLASRDIMDSRTKSMISSKENLMELYKIYKALSKDKQNLIRDVDSISDKYIASTIVSQLVEDAMAPDISTEKVLNITSKNRAVKVEIDKLNKIFKFDKFVEQIAYDAFMYGEYYIRLDVDAAGKTGITAWYDDVDQAEVVPYLESGELIGYIKPNYNHKVKRDVDLEPAYKYGRFSYGTRKVEIKLQGIDRVIERMTKTDKTRTVKSVKVGNPIFYGLVDKVKDLMLLESLVPAGRIAQLSSASLVGVTVPGSYPIQQAKEFASSVEDMINDKVSISSDGLISAADIISAAGSTKVVPVFGEKGQLQKFDYKNDAQRDIITEIADIRQIICDSIGIPKELLYGDSNSESKKEFLRRYARYLRKLRNLQFCIIDSIRNLIIIHLINTSVSFKEDDIDISFIKAIVEIDNLDSLEYIDASIQALTNLNTFITTALTDESPIGIDKEKYGIFIKDQFRLIGMDDVILIKKNLPDKITATPDSTTPTNNGSKPPITN